MNEEIQAVFAQRSLERDNALAELRQAVAILATWESLGAEHLERCNRHVLDALAWLEGRNPTLAKPLAAAQGELPHAHTGYKPNGATVTRRPLSMSPELWPAPTMEESDLETLGDWVFDGDCEATDGCVTDPDGFCCHGYPSWLLYLGLI